MKKDVNEITNEAISYHIIGKENLKLNELLRCLSFINNSIKKCVKEQKMHRIIDEEYSPEIKRVSNGSVIITLIFKVIEKAMIELLKDYLEEEIRRHFDKNINFNNFHETDKLFKVRIEHIEKGFEISLHINNKEYKW